MEWIGEVSLIFFFILMAESMTTALIMRALQHAYALRKPPWGLLHHSDRGSQYTSRTYRKQ